jgi:ABC-type phosphate transport system permease subunit
VIANEFREATNVGLHRSALLALAAILVVISLCLAALSRLLVRRIADVAGGPATMEGAVEPSALKVSG